MYLILISLISYLLGSVPFSYFVARAYGKNLYEIGSKNIGTANVFRATKKVEALLMALIGDAGKGALAIILVQKFAYLGYNLLYAQFLAAFFIVLGHNWPIFLKFKGGRGLASLAGVLLVLEWKGFVYGFIIMILLTILVEIILKKGIKLEGSFNQKFKKLFSVLISQIIGRIVGIISGLIFIFILNPEAIKISCGAVVLTGLKHTKRTKEFLEKENGKNR